MREVWSASGHGPGGRYVAAQLLRHDGGRLELAVGGDGGGARRLGLDVDDARSLWAALGEALQDDDRGRC